MSRHLVTATLRGVELGAGRPSICVPLVGHTTAELDDGARALPIESVDVVELRIDRFDAVGEPASVREAIRTVRNALPDRVPLIFTFRTTREGGERDIEPAAYEELIALAVETGGIDAVDVEMATEAERLTRIVDDAHASGVPVIMSSHDFATTPSVADMVDRLVAQQDLGADVVKLAVTPHTPQDVLSLLTATSLFRTDHARRPAITMSMGPLGVVSRVSGHTFGSCLTFGMAGESSAPGQLDARHLRGVLDILNPPD